MNEMEQMFRRWAREEFEKLMAEERKAPRRVERTGEADELISKTQAAALVNVSPSTINAWIRQGALKLYGLGNVHRLKRSEVLNVAHEPSQSPEKDDFEAVAERLTRAG